MSLIVGPARTPIHGGRIAVIILTFFVFLFLQCFAAENEAPLPAPFPVQETNSADLLRANLQLQEQVHGLQLSIDETRKEAEAAAQRNAEAVANRLQSLEQTMTAERARDLDAVRASNRLTVIVASSFGVIGVLVMLLMAYQWRTVSRLAEVSAGLPSRPLLTGGGGLPAISDGDNRLIAGAIAEQSNTRLLGAMERLEKRIHELGQMGHAPPTGRLAGAKDRGSGAAGSASASDSEHSSQSPNG